MKTSFDHEKLDVYQESIRLVSWVDELLGEIPRSLAVHNQLDRASTSIPLNIAEGTGRFSGTDQAKFFGIAYKATVQSAALVDLAVASASAEPSRVEEGRTLLRRIAAMLTSLSKVAADGA